MTKVALIDALWERILKNDESEETGYRISLENKGKPLWEFESSLTEKEFRILYKAFLSELDAQSVTIEYIESDKYQVEVISSDGKPETIDSKIFELLWLALIDDYFQLNRRERREFMKELNFIDVDKWQGWLFSPNVTKLYVSV